MIFDISDKQKLGIIFVANFIHIYRLRNQSFINLFVKKCQIRKKIVFFVDSFIFYNVL